MKRIFTTDSLTTLKEGYVNGFFGILLILCAGVISCSSPSSSTSTTSEPSEAETADNPEASSEDEIVFTEEGIAELKSKFTFNEEAGWYYHNHWNQRAPKRRTLTADVNKSGYYYLSSIFYANDGIKHTQVQATIGEEKIKTEAIAQSENENTTMKADDRTFEIINYTNYRDNKMLEAIANAEEEISIRFIGPDSYSDAELPASDQRALKDCYQLTLVLRAEAQQAQ